MNNLEMGHPITSSMVEGAIVGAIAGVTSPFTPIATGFLAAAAVVLGTYARSSGSRPKCSRSQKQTADPSLR